MSLPGSIGLLSRFKATPSGTSPVGTTGIAATQVAYGSAANTIKGSAQLLFVESDSMKFSTAVTGGIQLYNTADQTTNFERLSLLWTTNTAKLIHQVGGTGTARLLQIQATVSTITLNNTSVGGQIGFAGNSSGAANGGCFAITGFNSTASSGSGFGVSLALTYNQTLTAGGSDFKIARTETALGSGSHLFLEFLGGAAGTTTRFTVAAATGLITHSSPVLIATNVALTNTAAANVATITNSPVAGNPTKWITINDNGTVRSIPTWS